MYNVVLIGVFALSALGIISALIFLRLAGKKVQISKRISDAQKLISADSKKKYIFDLKNYAMVSAVLTVSLLYAFGWHSAVTFLVPAILLPLMDYYFSINIVNFSTKIAQQTRDEKKTVFNSIFGFSLWNAVVYISVAIALGLGTQILFSDTATLFSLAFGSILSAVFFWPQGKSKFSALIITSIALAFAQFGYLLPQASNFKLFAAGLFSATTVFVLISAVLTTIVAKKKTRIMGIYLGLVLTSLLLCAVFYFGVLKHFDDSGYNLILISATLAIGLVIGLFNIFFHKVGKIVPIISAGVLFLASNYFFGTFGVGLMLLGFLSLTLIVAVYNIYATVLKNSELAAETAELSEESVTLLQAGRIPEIKTNNFVITALVLLSFGFLSYFVSEMAKYSLDLGNQKIIAGLVLGAAVAHLSNLDFFRNKLLKTSSVVIVVIAAGLVLGPVYLAGALAGALLVNLLTPSANEEVLLATVLAVLISAFIENPFSLTIRAIIGGGLLVILVAYYIFTKFYGGRKTV